MRKRKAKEEYRNIFSVFIELLEKGTQKKGKGII